MAIAFFDLDKTLLSVNSGTLWVRREVALGHISKRRALRAVLWLAQYELGLANAEQMVEQAVSYAAGTPSAELRARTARFWEEEVRTTWRPGGLEALRAHRAAGDRCVLLTSSTNYLAELAAAELGLDWVLCNRLQVDAAGLHTGRVEGRICFGAGKLVHARAEADRQGVGLGLCAFYTDSFSDVPVLEVVGRPVAVNPDLRLKRLAQKRRWMTVDWGVPLSKVA